MTERQAEAVLNSPLAIDASPRWASRGQWWKAEVNVANVHQLGLRMTLSISKTLPGKYTFQVLNGNQVVRRLDVRSSHRNLDAGDNSEVWDVRTHKHRLTDLWGDSWAYTPNDLPDTSSPVSKVAPGEYRDVFKAFCAECNIQDNDRWQDPTDEMGEEVGP